MLADRAYGRAELREELDERGTKPVIPNRCNRKKPFSFSKRLYKLRWRIENAFNRLKDFRRVATRYDKLARNYLASVCLAAALVSMSSATSGGPPGSNTMPRSRYCRRPGHLNQSLLTSTKSSPTLMRTLANIL